MPLPFILGAVAAGALSTLGTAATVATGTAIAGAGAGAAYVAAKKLLEPDKPTKEVYTTDEAMKVLGMSKPTILKKMKEGEIPYEGPGGRGGFRIKSEALAKYAELNNIVPNWGVEIQSSSTQEDIVAVEEAIKMAEILKEEAELELEELMLEEDDTVEYKRKLIQSKKKINNVEKEIQAWKTLLLALKAK